MVLNTRACSIAVAVMCVVVLGAAVCFAEPAETQSASALGNKDPRKQETAISNLVADAVREATRANIAFVAASEIKPTREPLPAGTVSSSAVAGLISYPGDPLTVLRVDGKTVRKALEKSVAIYPQRSLGFLQVSGIKFKFDPKKKPGSRVTSATVGKKPLDDSAFYTVGVTKSMANGALGYWKVWKKKDIDKKLPDANIVKAVECLFRARPRIDYGKLDRITRDEGS